MSETIETFEDIEDAIAEELTEEPRRRTVLEVWREVLSNVPEAADEPITMDTAVRLLGAHGFLTMRELSDYSGFYFSILEEAAGILEAELELDPTALEAGEEDGDVNRSAYLNLLINWQKMLRVHEKNWTVDNMYAGPRLAAYIDGANFLVGRTGLAAHLSEIKFEFNDDDQELIRVAVNGDVEEQ